MGYKLMVWIVGKVIDIEIYKGEGGITKSRKFSVGNKIRDIVKILSALKARSNFTSHRIYSVCWHLTITGCRRRGLKTGPRGRRLCQDEEVNQITECHRDRVGSYLIFSMSGMRVDFSGKWISQMLGYTKKRKVSFYSYWFLERWAHKDQQFGMYHIM